MGSADASSGLISYGDSIISSGPVDVSKSIPYQNLKDRVVVITGGASGFGAAIAEEVVKHGGIVIIGDINTAGGERKVAYWRQSSNNHNHHFLKLDVTNWSNQAAFFKQAASLSPHGGLDCVIANAGISDTAEQQLFENPPDYQSIENPPPPRMKTLDVNLTGVMHTTTLALSYLSRNPGSVATTLASTPGPRDRHLILISSIAGLAALPTLSIYGAAKHGVVGLFRSLRTTTPTTVGVRVNMINPYFVETGIVTAGAVLVLAGGALAKIEDVVNATTRLVADKSIVGRGLIVGARGSAEQLKNAGIEIADGLDEQGIWDVYADDFAQSDMFTRRVIGVTNIVAAARGWFGVFSDIAWVLSTPIRKSFGVI